MLSYMRETWAIWKGLGAIGRPSKSGVVILQLIAPFGALAQRQSNLVMKWYHRTLSSKGSLAKKGEQGP